jgi:hypothetical protein
LRSPKREPRPALLVLELTSGGAAERASLRHSGRSEWQAAGNAGRFGRVAQRRSGATGLPSGG